MSRRANLRRILDAHEQAIAAERQARAEGSARAARAERELLRREHDAARARRAMGDMSRAAARLADVARETVSGRAGMGSGGAAWVITREAVQRRVLRACLTHHVSPRVRGPECRVYWPATLTEFADLIARAESDDCDGGRRVMFRPTPEDIADEVTALGWMLRLTRRSGRDQPLGDWELVYLRALGWGWSELGRRLGGRTRGVAERRFVAAIEQCWRAAVAEQAAGRKRWNGERR